MRVLFQRGGKGGGSCACAGMTSFLGYNDRTTIISNQDTKKAMSVHGPCTGVTSLPDTTIRIPYHLVETQMNILDSLMTCDQSINQLMRY